MTLIVRGMNHGKKTQFKHLWGRYVLGFKPWTHCMKCFVTRQAKGILPTMVDGEYPLDDSFELFYLCGVGWKDIVGILMFTWPSVLEPEVSRRQDQFMVCNSQSQMRSQF